MQTQDIRKSEFILFWQTQSQTVADGHLTPEPVESIYSGVVSLRNLTLIFLGRLNNLELWGADIGNAYLEAPTEEKLYIVAGPEFEIHTYFLKSTLWVIIIG